MAKQNGPKEPASQGIEAIVPSTVTPAEFEKIPLAFIIATPLLTTIEAHKAAASTTLEFIQGIKDQVAEFTLKVKKSDSEGVNRDEDIKVSVPLLSIVKIPSLTFDSLSVAFNYNISQVYKQIDTSAQKAELTATSKGVLAKFLSASLMGSVEHSRTRENVANRGGSLEIKLHVSETQIPPGLEKIINAIVENIEVPLSVKE
jgi:hypothetical protein